MPLFYSASAGGFLDDEVHVSIPEDARPVAVEAHRELIAAASSGSIIVPDSNGDPVAVPLPPPEPSELLRQMRTKRDRLLSESDFTQMPDSPLIASAREEWRVYRQALRDLPETVADLSAIDWPSAPSN